VADAVLVWGSLGGRCYRARQLGQPRITEGGERAMPELVGSRTQDNLLQAAPTSSHAGQAQPRDNR
jgi:hypothetical protein